jgi:hypothetical protein
MNFSKLGLRNRKKARKSKIRAIFCLFLVLLFLINFLFMNINNFQPIITNTGAPYNKNELDDEKPQQPKLSTPPELLQDPYTTNFSEMWTFFSNNFRSSYDFGIDLYVNESDNTGTILHNATYSADNLLLYKSLINNKLINQKDEHLYYNESETFQAYLDLQSTPLWYEGNVSQYKYGFVKSINGTTGNSIDDKRYLYDNLLPIFLLLENLDTEINNPINGKLPKNYVFQMFKLINSSEFWDSTNEGFYETNSSTGADKYAKSNLYSVIANFMLYKYNLNFSDRAYELANITMKTLLENMWDNNYKGFYYRASNAWVPDPTPSIDTRKYLDVNALGIIALLDYWIMTGMHPNSDYYKNATLLYDRLNKDSALALDGGLWNTNYKAYEYGHNYKWDQLANPEFERIDLEANALMMLACLKLFEVNGSYKYYDRAITLFESISKYFYNVSIDAHKIAHHSGAPNNPNILLHSNLRLCEAYLKAFEIYNNSALEATYNITGKIDYIVNQERINLTSTYFFERDVNYYYGPGASQQDGVNKTRFENITGATVYFDFLYSNDTIFGSQIEYTVNSSVNILYDINSSLPFEDGYYITILANTTYFRFQHTTKTFNVKSGLEIIRPITSLKDSYFQGEKSNFTIVVSSKYNFNLTLNITLSGNGIGEYRTNATFLNNTQTSVELNITINNDAPTDFINLYFTFYNDSIIYLKDYEEIEIKTALTYFNLRYSKDVVRGDGVIVFMDLMNYLSNQSQSFNLTFTGSYIRTFSPNLFTLEGGERISESFILFTKSIIKESLITIGMSISVNDTVYHTDTLTVNIVPSLEIVEIEFPETVPHWVSPQLILQIKNNRKSNEEFSLYINDEKMETNIDELKPGENRIDVHVFPALNPYELGIKKCEIEIEDSTEDVIIKDYYEYELTITALDLIVFYIMPIGFSVGFILYFKNKLIKHKLLKR